MSLSLVDDFEIPFEIVEPAAQTTPLVFNSPHSGRQYLRSFVAASRLDAMALRRSEDSFVEELFEGVVDLGAPLMRAHFPRAYLDVNREPYELDPRMFEGRLPSFANTRSMRVAGGLGTIARIVGDSQEIYARRLPVEHALLRIEHLYKPYHRALQKRIQATHRRFGLAILVDCHSMPSSQNLRDEQPRADFVIGDRYGTSSSGHFSDVIDSALRARGYTVTRNKPYAGGFITEHYGNPAADSHALQIEVSRALYMDERRFEKAERFELVARDLVGVAAELADEADRTMRFGRMAAE
jgi:N-formylglutamate deformylase